MKTDPQTTSDWNDALEHAAKIVEKYAPNNNDERKEHERRTD